MKIFLKLNLALAICSFGMFGLSESLHAQGQGADNGYRVTQVSGQGNKVFLELDLLQLEAVLDSVYNNISSVSSSSSSLTWGDVLTNGSNPGMDVNFSGYDLTNAGNVTTTGTLTGDSLLLNKDASITGRLGVTDVASFGDSLTVAGFVQFSDSLKVVKAVAIGQTLHVTGVTSLGDSLHVAGNVDFDALFNVDGAATFGSTLTVTDVTSLSDSLHVTGGADFDSTLNVDGNADLQSALDVDGATTLNSTLTVTGVTSLSDSLHVTGGADFDSTLNVDGNADLQSALDVDGATTLNSTLTVTGVTSLNDSLQVNSSVNVTGDFNLGGEFQAKALRADSSLTQGGTASNYNTTALGVSTASGIGAVAAGYTASATGTQSTAIGTLASASGINAVAIGESAQASATQGVAVGKSAQVSGSYANVAVGVNSQVTAGWGNTAIGGGKVNATTGTPTYSVAIGNSTISSGGAYNVALGGNSTISGNGSTAYSMTFGPYSAVDGGYRNMAMGSNASIGGGANSGYALGDYSSIYGGAWHGYALGDHSKVQANGHHALAFGPYSEVSAFNAANFAYDSPARFSHQAVFGAYADTTVMVPGGSSHNDWIGTDPLFVVANGATESSRSNALVIRKDGAAMFSDSMHVAGHVTLGDQLTVSGSTALNDSVHIGGALDVSNNFGNLSVGVSPFVPEAAGVTTFGLLNHSLGMVGLTENLFDISIANQTRLELGGIESFAPEMSESERAAYYQSLNSMILVQAPAQAIYDSLVSTFGTGQITTSFDLMGPSSYTGDTQLSWARDTMMMVTNQMILDADSTQFVGELLVAGETRLNDSLHVYSGAEISATLYADSTSTNGLSVAGSVRIADGTEGAGKVLTSDANGYATWQAPSTGGSTIPFNTYEAWIDDASIVSGVTVSTTSAHMFVDSASVYNADPSSYFSLSAGGVTVSTTGYYDIEGYIFGSRSTLGSGFITGSVTSNENAALPQCTSTEEWSQSINSSVRTNCRLLLNAGDVVKLNVIEQSGGTSSVSDAGMRLQLVGTYNVP
jgi:hypothetical protein